MLIWVNWPKVNAQQEAHIETLARKLGMGHALAIIVGTVIGSGVFITLPIVARATGSPWLAAGAWLLGGLLWIPQIFVLSELATAYPDQGFGYLYLRKAGSPLLAFLYVWTAFITSDTPSISIIALIAISSLTVFWLFLQDPWTAKMLACLMIVLLTLPHIRDVRRGGNLQIVLTIAKISPLLLLIVIGFFHMGSGLLATAGPARTANIFSLLLAGTTATVWSYAGFPNILYMAGEIENPRQTLPRALIGSVAGVTLAYLLISLAASAIIPHGELAAISGAFANPFACLPAWAGIAGGFLAIAAFVSMAGALNGCIMVQPRLEYAVARDGLFFKSFAAVHPKFHTPYLSILIQSGLAIILTLIGGIEPLLGYFTLSYVLQNALVYGSIFWLRHRSDYAPSYRTPAWRIMAVLAVLSQLFLAYGTFLAYSATGVLASLALILTGVPVYFYFRQKQNDTLSRQGAKTLKKTKSTSN